MGTLQKIKISRSIKAWFGTFIRVFFSPFGSIENVFQLLTFPVVLFIFKILTGEESGVRMAWDAIKDAGIFALVWSAVIYVIVAAIITSFKFRKEEKEKGAWFGRTYVYNEPQLVLTQLASPKDNGKEFFFKCPDVEKDSIVNFKFDADTTDPSLLRVDISGEKQPPLFLGGSSIKIGMRIGADKKLRFMTKMADNAADSIIRVFVVSFKV